MNCNRFTDEQIIGIRKEHEAGIPVSKLCRNHGVSDSSINKWKAKFRGMEGSSAKRLMADAMFDNAALQDIMGKNR